VIDLHLHTTASDGLLSPTALVERVSGVGVSAIAVTDHDTFDGLSEAADAAADRGLRFLSGVEVTAVDAERDVHILGYGFDRASTSLASFLAEQREHRVARIHHIVSRLAELGMPLGAASIDALLGGESAPSNHGRSVGRPRVARALVAAGYVASVQEAFDLWLGRDCPAFVPREGASPQEVVAIIAAAGGTAALAHPGLTGRDDLIPVLAAAGMGALEVWHSEHDESAVLRYRAIAEQHGLLPVGGSDFHGDGAGRSHKLGQVGTPPEVFDALLNGRLAI